MRKLLLIIQLLFFSGIALANPSGINLSGKITLNSTHAPLTAADVDFKVRVLSPDGCVLYSEKFLNVDLSASNGVFNLTIGTGTALYNAWDATLGTANSKASLLKVFSNGAVPIASGLQNYPGETCSGGAYTPTDGDVRKVVIEFDPTGADINANYVALSPYHRIRSVPYAMLADQAANSDKLGGLAASAYAKTTDLATSVPAAETDPNVQGFAKTAITGLTSGSCGAGKVLSYNGTALTCVTDGGGSSASIATNTVAGTVLVESSSNVSLNLTTGALDVKDLAISKITGLQTALNGAVKYGDMPATSCSTGQALVWTTPDDFTCAAITVDSAHVSDFSTAVNTLISSAETTTPKLARAGGTMTGDINMGNKYLLNVGYVHLENKTADPSMVAANNGYVWYNSTDKLLKYYDGAATKALPGYAGTCADGEILKWNNTTKVWACGTDSGASGGANAAQLQGANVSATTPTAGQFLKYVSSAWTPTSMPVCTASQTLLFDSSGTATCTAISGLTDSAISASAAIARSKIATGTNNHVLINDGSGNLSSEASLAVTRGGTGQTTFANGELLIGNTTGNTLTKATLTQGTGISITNGTGSITIAASGNASHISSGTLAVAYGGTGANSFTANALVMAGATSTSALSAITCAATGRHLEWNGTTWACSNDLLTSGVAGSKVNYVLITGSATGVATSVEATGTDTNVDLTLKAKGTGKINIPNALALSGTYTESSTAPVDSVASQAVPVTSNIYRVTLAAATTFTLPACPAATDTAFNLTIKMAQKTPGNFTASWSANVTWDSGTAPDPAMTTGAVTIYQFLCFGGESTWYGMQVWKAQ